MRPLSVCFALFFLFIFQAFSQNRPTGLLTDLLSGTDKVYHSGHISSVSLWNAGESVEALTFAEVRSTHPSFSWIVPGNENGTVQTGYRLIIADAYGDAQAGKGTVWDSKSVQSNRSTGVLLEGKGLLPSKTYYWRVKTFTNKGAESDWSAVKAFRTAAHLELYAPSHEELVKTAVYPSSLNTIAPDVQLADFGRDAFGQLTLQLSSETGLDTVEIALGEVLANGRIDRKPGGTIRYQQFRIALAKGRHTYQVVIPKDKRNTGPAAIKMPEYIGEVMPFRYAEIQGYKLPVNKTDLVREMVHYPFDDSSADFKSSDELLNQIWELCKYSIKATSFTGIYIDGDRERIPYEADALINQLGHYGTDRNYSMARRSIEYLLKRPTWPTEWILQALIISWNDYLYTGDARFLQASYEILKNRTLLQLKEKNGLISTKTGLQTPAFAASINFKGEIRDIVDWPLSETDGFVFGNYNAVVNAYHYKALTLMEKIAEVLDKKQDAMYYAAQSKALKDVYNRAFLDKKRGVYKDSDTTSHSSLHSNMFAMHFGLVPVQYISSVMNFIVSRKMACSVYGSQFLMDALYDAGYSKDALALLTSKGERSWSNMIDVGSTITLEAWDNKFKPNQDWNHAWGAAPANIIPRRLMGVEPLKPGFELVSVKPQTAGLAFAASSIPTIRGDIKIRVDNKDIYTLTLTLPANMEAEVYLPKISGKEKMTYNGQPWGLKSIKGSSFNYAGKVSSGKHVFELSSR